MSGVQVSKFGFTAADHIKTTVHEKKKLVLHFYSKEVSEEEFPVLEKNHLLADEYGVEVMVKNGTTIACFTWDFVFLLCVLATLMLFVTSSNKRETKSTPSISSEDGVGLPTWRGLVLILMV